MTQTFSDEESLAESVAGTPALPEFLKEVLQTEGK